MGEQLSADELRVVLKWVNWQIAELEWFGVLLDEYEEFLLYRLKHWRDELQAALAPPAPVGDAEGVGQGDGHGA